MGLSRAHAMLDRGLETVTSRRRRSAALLISRQSYTIVLSPAGFWSPSGRCRWASIKDCIYLRTNHYRHPTAGDWPAPLVAKLNASEPVAWDWVLIGLAARQYGEQVCLSKGKRTRLEASPVQSPPSVPSATHRCQKRWGREF